MGEDLESRIEWEIICNDCGDRFTIFEVRSKFDETLEKERCLTCGGTMRRSWAFGMGKFNGSGYTRSST